MNYNAHRIGGVCFGIVSSCLIYQTPPTEEKLALSIILISGAYVGSLIPDLDHPKSYLGKKFKTLSNTLNKLFGHRGLTHTPIMYFIFSAILYLISVFVALRRLTLLSLSLISLYTFFKQICTK